MASWDLPRRSTAGMVVYGVVAGEAGLQGTDGVLTASAVVQAQQDTVRVEVVDADRDLDSLQVDMVTVEVVNGRSGAAAIRSLLETGPSTGVFRARLPMDESGLPIQVQGGDQLLVRYVDLKTVEGGSAERTAWVEVIDRFGDLTGSGTVSSLDAHAVLRIAAGLETASPWQRLVGDVSGSGTIQAFDASLILQFIVGLIPRFPVQGSSINHPF